TRSSVRPLLPVDAWQPVHPPATRGAQRRTPAPNLGPHRRARRPPLKRADAGIRTLTVQDLNLVPLPRLGYVGVCGQDTDVPTEAYTCDECGFELALDDAEATGPAIVEGVAEIADVVGGAGSSLRARPEPDVWSPLEYACHLR